MKTIQIKIGNTAYPVKFGYGAIRLLGERWGLDGFAEVVEKVGGLVPNDGDTAEMLKFETLERLAEVICAGITNAGGMQENIDLEIDGVIDAFFEDMSLLTKVFELFTASMPQQRPNPAEGRGKQKALPKTRAKKK